MPQLLWLERDLFAKTIPIMSDSDDDFLCLKPSRRHASQQPPVEVVVVAEVAEVSEVPDAAQVGEVAEEQDAGELCLITPPVCSTATRLQQALRGVHNRDRADLQHLLLSQHMRTIKAARRHARQCEEQANMLSRHSEALAGHLVRVNSAQRVRGQSLVLSLLSGDGARHLRLSASAWVRITYEFPSCSDHAIAQIFQVDQCLVRRVRACCALVHYNRQNALLARLAAQSAQSEFAFSVFSLRFDCTSRILTAPLHPTLSPTLRKSKFEVLVALSELCVGFKSESPWCINAVNHVNMVRPCIPLATTAAPCIDYGLFRAPQVASQWSGVEEILSKSSVVAIGAD